MKRRSGDSLPRQYRAIVGFVRARSGSLVEADDVVQDVFVDAAKVLAASAREAPPTLGWLYTVARRRLIDESRRRARRRSVSLELVPDPGGEEDGYGGLVAEAFTSALALLNEGQRRVVVLRLLEGRSFEEIAAALGVTQEACRMRFMRGLEQIRAEFEKEGLTP